MKAKRTLAVISAVALVATLTTAAFASGDVKGEFKKERPAMGEMQRPERVELTDEQRAEMPMFGGMRGERPEFGGKRGEFSGEWPELTDEQKAEMLVEMKARLAEDLAEGKLTEEQYDEMLAAVEAGKMGFMRGGIRGGHPGFDGECPEFDGKRGEFNGERPEFDGARPGRL